jgi:putative flippase GtrA
LSMCAHQANRAQAPPPRSRELTREILRFSSVGIINTLVDLVVFSFLVGLVGMNPVVANILSYSAGLLNSYALHSHFTFRYRNNRKRRCKFTCFTLGNLGALCLSTAVIAYLTPLVSVVFAKAAALAASASLTFVITRSVFRGGRMTSGADQTFPRGLTHGRG